MPDIRNFFGGSQSQSQQSPNAKETKKPGKSKRVIISSDEEEDVKPKSSKAKAKASPKKPTKKEVEEVEASKFFEGSDIKRVDRPAARTSNGRKKTKVEDDDNFEDLDDDVFESMDLDAVVPPRHETTKKDTPKKAAPKKESPKKATPKKATPQKTSAKESSKAATKKRKAQEVEEDEEDYEDNANGKDHDDEDDDDDDFFDDGDDDDAKPAKKLSKSSKSQPSKAATKSTKTKASPVKKAKIEDDDEEAPAEEPKKKFQFWKKKESSGPRAPGSKEIPEGAPGCLDGLTFVFTGELSSIGRDDASDLVKRYGGRVTGAPSGKTSYVVVGEEAGASKLEKIKKLNLKTLDEDGLFDLIRGTTAKDPAAAERAAEAKKKEEATARKMAAEMEAEEVAEASKKAKANGTSKGKQSSEAAAGQNQLWTTKYMPTKLKDICGNKAQVEKLSDWLHHWHDLYEHGKKDKPAGPFAKETSSFKAVLISGPPGIGKTTAAHLASRLEGFDPIEFNASDTRSKKLLESNITEMVDNHSLGGYFGASSMDDYVDKKRIVIIMDEVDGMSAGDRGGVGALNALIKKTKVPIICICNDRSSQKIKPLTFTSFDMRFQRPQASMIRGRILSIAFKEGLNIPGNVIDQLVAVASSDIRQVLNMLSMYRISQSTIDFDQGKNLGNMSEKHIALGPWAIVAKLFANSTWNEASHTSLNDKIELYFHDHAFAPLMVQENYLNTNPMLAHNAGNVRETQLKELELTSKAADSISDGDLVDAMIHGSQQHWTLMPLHGLLSCVRPSSYIHGPGKGGQGFGGGYQFSSWLGKNSTQGKNYRQLRSVQAHMRLRTSADKSEIRQSYMPAILPLLTQPLHDREKEAIPEVIELMDSYFLDREDWDIIAELALSKAPEASTATKSAFTRTYNQMKHPVAFNKPTDVTKAAGAKTAADAPDYEDAMEAEDQQGSSEPEAEDDDDDITKDKLIKDKAAKGKSKSAGKAKASSSSTRGRGGSSRGTSSSRGRK